MNSSKQQLCRRRFFKKNVFLETTILRLIRKMNEIASLGGQEGGVTLFVPVFLFLLLFCLFNHSSYITFKLFCFIICGLCSFLSLVFVLLFNVSFIDLGSTITLSVWFFSFCLCFCSSCNVAFYVLRFICCYFSLFYHNSF
jgi:hypothetical protein